MVDIYRDYRFRSGQLASGPVIFDWSTVPGATADFFSPYNQNPTVDGGAMVSLQSRFGPAIIQNAQGSPVYDADGVNGHPGVRLDSTSYMYVSPATLGSLIGTPPAPFETCWSGTVVSPPSFAMPVNGGLFNAPSYYGGPTFRLSMKPFADSGAGGVIKFAAQIYNPTDTFRYCVCSSGSAILQPFYVVDMRYDGTRMLISVNGGAEASDTNGGPQSTIAGSSLHINFENQGGPVPANQCLSRLVLRTAAVGGRTDAYITSEITRLSTPP